MPFKLKQIGDGWKVVSPDHPQGFSKKPLPKKRAQAQLRIIKKNYYGDKGKADN